MFDKIFLKCPNCKGTLEFQSKGGECMLDEYEEGNVSWDVILPVNGEIVRCLKCLKNIRLKIVNLPPKPKIKLEVTKRKASYSGETSNL